MASADRTFLVVSVLLFVVSAAVTVAWSASMSSMPAMPMPGGWSMSMAWMRMPEQTWAVTAASFLGMWIVMMMAMMLPSLIPMLRRYRQTVTTTSKKRLGLLTVLVGAGYFFVWTVFGIVAFPLGVALTTMEMQQPTLSRAVPFAIAVAVVVAGLMQFSPWKLRHLACCRGVPAPVRTRAGSVSALRHGVRLGLHCAQCCANLMVVLLIIGVMDIRVMAVVAAAIAAERLAPAGEPTARAIGAAAAAIGVVLIARASGLA